MNGEHKMEKKKFLFVSWISLSGDLAWKIQREGHEVKAYIDNKLERDDVYSGILDKVDDWKKWVDWADVIIFDDIGFGRHAEALRKKGKKVIGGSSYTDRLEHNREFGQEEMDRVGMQVLPHWYFSNFESAIAFIEKNPARYVFKPSGKAQDNKGWLFIGEEEDGADILELLRTNEVIWKTKIKTFQLQKYASGVEIAVGAFFNGKKFLHP
ncbi:MAG: phosphoribosylamine--glycine ligase, partial [Patescibacteria group bacterium]|nr:phosphoribosylamine--glycine ligase [Patescibacteria group bacterium]